MEKKLLMIVNPRAGRNKSHGPLFDAAAIFSEAGYLLRIHRTTAPGDATETVAREGSQYDLVVASGGDGTLNETIAGLVQLDNPPLLGYLPQGSTHDFASSLHISDDPAAAAEVIVQEHVQVLDVGLWNQRPFAYVASFGAFTRTSYTASQASKNALGHFAYILEGMKDLNSLRPYRIRVTADGEVLDGDYLFGAVCNSTSIGGLMKLDPERVVLDDGLSLDDVVELGLVLMVVVTDGAAGVHRHVGEHAAVAVETLLVGQVLDVDEALAVLDADVLPGAVFRQGVHGMEPPW